MDTEARKLKKRFKTYKNVKFNRILYYRVWLEQSFLEMAEETYWERIKRLFNRKPLLFDDLERAEELEYAQGNAGKAGRYSSDA